MKIQRPEVFQGRTGWYAAGFLVTLLAISAGTAIAQQESLRVGI